MRPDAYKKQIALGIAVRFVEIINDNSNDKFMFVNIICNYNFYICRFHVYNGYP